MGRVANVTRFIAGMVIFTGVALADYTLDFNIITPTAGSISYAGTGGPLVGSGISVDSVVTDTGSTVTCTNCFLNFSTGNLSSYTAGDWDFAEGGTLTLTGTVDVNGNTVSGTLFSGYFADAGVFGFGNNSFKVAIADFLIQNGPVASAFGVLLNDGDFNISFSATTNGQSFASSQMGSGDIFAGAPEPATIVLLGTVLLGCVAILRRRIV